jgi:hypothetical protein
MIIIEVANFGEATIKHGLPYEVSWPGFTYNDTCKTKAPAKLPAWK